jgi:hypothetical protein
MFKVTQAKSEWDFYYSKLCEKSVYGSFGYVKTAEFVEKETIAELAVFESEGILCFHPYIKRCIPLDPGYYDIISPYDFGGFWFNTVDDHNKEQILSEFLINFDEYCRKNNIVSEFIRFCPFVYHPITTFYNLDFVENNIIIRLGKSWGKVTGQYHPSLKRDIKRADSFGLAVSRKMEVKDFITLYHQSLDALDSEDYYYFSYEFLAQLPNLDLLSVEDQEGIVCAAHLYLIDNDVIYYFLSASNRKMLHKRPNDFLLNFMISDANEKGFHTVHLGGGRSESLYRFKRKFSKETIPYIIGKKIFKPNSYDHLVKKQEQEFRVNLEGSSFFPLYRYTPDNI